jgi:hypothetical protein
MKLNLFNPVMQRLMLLNEIADAEGVLTPELEEQLTVTDDRVQERVLELLQLRETAKTQILGADAELERLKAVKTAAFHAVELIEACLLDATKRLGPIQAGTYKVGTRLSTATVIDNEALLPPAYLRTIPESTAPDKTAIGKALKAGEAVPGASLETRQNLAIK